MWGRHHIDGKLWSGVYRPSGKSLIAGVKLLVAVVLFPAGTLLRLGQFRLDHAPSLSQFFHLCFGGGDDLLTKVSN